MSKTEIKIFSRIGSTPITKRGGQYCDLLVDTVVECETPGEARQFAHDIIVAHPHGDYAHFYMPNYWNHNTNCGWTH